MQPDFVYQNNLINQDMVLLDEEFLATLSEQKEREIYAKIIALDINELPIDSIEGKVTTGSINLDGSSAVRRTCSLTMITDEIDINEFYWGVKTKFKLEIGLRNNLSGQYAATDVSEYPAIVWFPQGTFVISTFNTSITTNNCTISLQGKDKMCLLNGELGGQLFASIDFGSEEIQSRVMNNVSNQITASSSDVIMTQKYYRKITNVADAPSVVYSNTNKDYLFVADSEGMYYKDGNKYCLTSNENINFLSHQLYQVYKRATTPEECFTPIEFSQTVPYEANKYYYEKIKNSNYFVLDDLEDAPRDVQHYALVPLYEEEYEYNIYQIPLEKIIRESVHTYAKEPYHNIIINDLDDYGLEQVTYKGDIDLYALRDKTTGHFTQLVLSGKNVSLENCISAAAFKGDSGFDSLTSDWTSDTGTVLYQNQDTKTFSLYQVASTDRPYTVARFRYGDDIGYRLTTLTYTGDLISAIGDTLVTILDKIKTMLGDFEYFYDTDGRFIFQRKRTYVNTAWSQLTESDGETYVDYVNSDRKKFSFNFEGNRLISAVQNSPVLTNLRNDFVVWGKRKSVSGAEIPIHARYAIDKKPVFYKALNGISYVVNEKYAVDALDIPQTFTPSTVIDAIKNFELSYAVPSFLSRPTKLPNGDWTPGWWDIRDWRNYYVLLTGEEPVGTMKFYSSNDENGCIPVYTLGGQFSNYAPNYAVWLIDITKNGVVNIGHGCGEYGRYSRECTYYESHYEGDRLVTVPTDTKEVFSYPYAGCADSHTYLYFLREIEEWEYQGVYFFNPHFPGATYEEVLEDKITNVYQEWLQFNQIKIVDWREIIYQMALDYFAAQGCSASNPLHLFHMEYDENGEIQKVPYEMTDPDHFLMEVADRNPYYFPTGYTGYEQYYTDMQGFWRQLYNPDQVPEEVYDTGNYILEKNVDKTSTYYTRHKVWQQETLTDIKIEYYLDESNPEIAAQHDRIKDIVVTNYQYLRALGGLNEEINQAIDGHVDDIEQVDAEIQQIVDSWPAAEYSDKILLYKTRLNQSLKILQHYESYLLTSTPGIDEEISGRLFWNVNIFNGNPETLNFWIDFLDSGTELAQFSVPMVGSRTKVVNEDKAGAIVYKEIPSMILYDAFKENSDRSEPDFSQLRGEIQDKSGYVFIYLPKGFAQYITISYRNMSVKNKIDELLYQFAYCIENVSLTTIPVYYLQPNTRIFVQDKTTGINGEYIVNRITLPLSYNGTMSISATKAPERLY